MSFLIEGICNNISCCGMHAKAMLQCIWDDAGWATTASSFSQRRNINTVWYPLIQLPIISRT